MEHHVKSQGQNDKKSAPVQSPPTPHAPIAQRSQKQQVAQLQSTVGNRRTNEIMQAKRVPTLQRRPRKMIQRFESNEHAMLGDEGSKGEHGEVRSVELAPDYRLTYGEMTAMGGDFFGGIAEMRSLANAKGQKGVGTREELEFVRVCKVRATSKEDADAKAKGFSPEVIAAVDKRYYGLALNNRAHFSNPEVGNENLETKQKANQSFTGQFLWNGVLRQGDIPNNAAGYRAYHVQAIEEAYKAGKSGKGIDQAMAVEAFGSHYLTDAFAGGHMRTARASISTHWNEKVPMFNHNLKGFMAQALAKALVPWYTTTDFAYSADNFAVSGALATVTAKIDAKGSLKFGDVVSGAVHDADNHNGVRVNVAGADTRMYGDGQLIDKDGNQHHADQKSFVTQAVNAGMQDVLKAWEDGKKNTDMQTVARQLVGTDGMFSPEQLLPKALPDSQVSEEDKRVKWDFNDVDALLNNDKFQKALALMAKEKVAEFEAVAAELEPDQEKAFKAAVIDPLRKNPVQFMKDVINWVPDTGGGVGGHNQDDNAIAYLNLAKKKNALPTLTVTQKVQLTRYIFDGVTTDADCALLMEMINAKPSDVQGMVNQLGWDAMEDELGDAFSEKYPKAKYAPVPAH